MHVKERSIEVALESWILAGYSWNHERRTSLNVPKIIKILLSIFIEALRLKLSTENFPNSIRISKSVDSMEFSRKRLTYFKTYRVLNSVVDLDQSASRNARGRT